MSDKKSATQLKEVPRTEKGTFPKGVSGNPLGRPKGSKNRITVLKAMVEEDFRENNAQAITEVLRMIVQQALEGDKAAQKLVWDAAVSKAASNDDKSAGSKQEIRIQTMNVGEKDKERYTGEIIDVETTEEVNEDE